MKFSTFAGVYFIPGVGQIASSASEAIVLGEIATGVRHWVYKTINDGLKNLQNNASKTNGTPKGLLDSNGRINFRNFNQKVNGKNALLNKILKQAMLKKITEGMAEESGKIKDKTGIGKLQLHVRTKLSI